MCDYESLRRGLVITLLIEQHYRDGLEKRAIAEGSAMEALVVNALHDLGVMKGVAPEGVVIDEEWPTDRSFHASQGKTYDLVRLKVAQEEPIPCGPPLDRSGDSWRRQGKRKGRWPR